MLNKHLIEPDVDFIKELVRLGADSVKKCFQCATCSVACQISPDTRPFPRKEMIAASWGLKDRLLRSADIWLCHNCQDCSVLCPRSARPGDVLAAVRSYVITEYAAPKFLGRAVNDPKKLPVLLAIPVLIFLALGLSTGWLDFTPEGSEIVHARFFSTWLVDLIFIPLAIWVIVIFARGVLRFLRGLHENAVAEGNTEDQDLDIKAYLLAIVRILPAILTHDKFNECTENKGRATAHLMVFYSFIGLFIVTNIFFVFLYVLQIHGPYSQLNPVKWLANISGVALIAGSLLMIADRLSKTDQKNRYGDWYLLGLVLALGLTGLLTEITRILDWAGLAYFLYFTHLVAVFCLFAYLPFSKLAHLVYRVVATGYAEYLQRR